jgi:DNA invertase Pin-like site-specific DNA recombinase
MREPDPGHQPVAYAYVRASTGDQKHTIEAQKELLDAFYRDRLQEKGYAWGGFYVDKATSAGVKLEERKAGSALLGRVRAGDAILITKLDRAFRKTREASHYLDLWTEEGITLHATINGIDTSNMMGRMFLLMASIFAEFERDLIRERTALVAKHRKARTGLTNQFPGYGFRLDGRKGSRRKEADQAERATMARIVALHDDEGLSFTEIYHKFLAERIQTRKGKLWTRDRIWRAYKAELRLRQRPPDGTSTTST